MIAEIHTVEFCQDANLRLVSVKRDEQDMCYEGGNGKKGSLIEERVRNQCRWREERTLIPRMFEKI